MVHFHTLLIGTVFYLQMGDLTRSMRERPVVLEEARDRVA